jgi:hypothetical protein
VVGALGWIVASYWTDEPYQQLARPFVIASCYFPALALVLRAPLHDVLQVVLARVKQLPDA